MAESSRFRSGKSWATVTRSSTLAELLRAFCRDRNIPLHNFSFSWSLSAPREVSSGMVAGKEDVVPMLALLSRRGFVGPPVAWARVREVVLSFEAGFQISGAGRGGDPKLADRSRPLLRLDQLPVLE